MIKVAPAGQKDAVEMRKVYAGFVAKQIEAGSEIIALEADLMSSMAMDGVARDYPQHVINCGIMEANVIGTAAGLSLTGRKPFVHTFTAFASRRCFDQLFMSLDYQRNNVKVIASDAGVTACHNGGTHMSFEDMGIVRGLAHSVVLEVNTSNEVSVDDKRWGDGGELIVQRQRGIPAGSADQNQIRHLRGDRFGARLADVQPRNLALFRNITPLAQKALRIRHAVVRRGRAAGNDRRVNRQQGAG